MLLSEFSKICIDFENFQNNLALNESPSAIADWLCRFDQWYKEELGINKGINCHLMYNRVLSISGQLLLANISSVRQLINSGQQCGFLVSLIIHIGECLEFSHELGELTNQFKGLSLIINSNNSYNFSTEKGLVNSVLPILENLASKKISLTFRGSLPFWMETGIFQSDIISETSYRLVPTKKEISRSFFGSYNPCAKKFQFVITSDGSIYPCLGLVGIESCRIGTIRQPLAIIWEEVQKHPLNLEELACQGPQLYEFNGQQENLQFGSICEAHRYKVIQN